MNPQDFLALLDTTLERCPPGTNSPTAFSLLAGTAAVESRLQYLYQRGEGPAIGLFQMEPSTARWLIDSRLTIPKLTPWKASRWAKALEPATGLRVSSLRDDEGTGYHLAGNLFLQIFLARLRYWVVTAPIPFTIEEQAVYWKVHYNTALGAGTSEKYLEAMKAVYGEGEMRAMELAIKLEETK